MSGLNVSSHLFPKPGEANYAILRGMAEVPMLARAYASGSGKTSFLLPMTARGQWRK
jgi:hypothetical protein